MRARINMEKVKWSELTAVMDMPAPDWTITGTVWGHPTNKGCVAPCPDATIVLTGTPREQMFQYKAWCKNPTISCSGHRYASRSMYMEYSEQECLARAISHRFPFLRNTCSIAYCILQNILVSVVEDMEEIIFDKEVA